jgi:hypothetical protein
MTSTPQEPLDEPVDTAAGQDAAGQAPVSGSPAEADSDLGYSRGDEGESAEQSGNAAEREDTGYLDSEVLPGPPGDSRGH